MIPKLRAPVVLVHGFCGFDRFSIGGLPIAQYFPGIPEALSEAGNRVLVPWLSAIEGVPKRAKQLKRFLDREVPNERFHLIAHSMGGLDSRYLISKMGLAERVLSLTTLGTPHQGTPFADWSLQHLEGMLKPVFQLLGIPTQGFYDLTTKGCRKFNEKVPDAPGVRYYSIAGDYQSKVLRPEWLLPHNVVWDAEGPNDGVVSVKSATYGELIATWPCDHWELVNWNNGLLPAEPMSEKGGSLFALLMQRLADEGF